MYHPHLVANCLILSEMSICLNMFRSPTNSPATSRPFDQVTTSAFSVSRSLVSRFASRFFLHRAFGFGFVAPHVALHRVSIRTLDEPSWCKLGAGWGSRGESMLPFLVRPLGPKRARSHRNTVSSQRVNMIISFRQHLRRRAHTALR